MTLLCRTVFLGLASTVFGSVLPRQNSDSSLDDCPGYSATNIQDDGFKLSADLSLAGTACDIYGDDLTELRLEVEYQTGALQPHMDLKQIPHATQYI